MVNSVDVSAQVGVELLKNMLDFQKEIVSQLIETSLSNQSSNNNIVEVNRGTLIDVKA
ncbi:MAG: putative motility protein [Desulfurobacteriaceae bacterium]